MGRLLVLVGVVLMIVGFVGPMLSMGDLFSSLQPTLNLATDASARQAQLCKQNEKLVEEHGASVYNPNQGAARPTISYCVDSEGHKRDVTEELVQSMLGNGIFGNVGNLISKSLIFVVLEILGIILLIIGIIASIGKRRGQRVTVSSPLIINRAEAKTVDARHLVTQLQALEQSLRQGLISQDEYNDARKRLLEGLQ